MWGRGHRSKALAAVTTLRPRAHVGLRPPNFLPHAPENECSSTCIHSPSRQSESKTSVMSAMGAMW